MKKLLLLAVIAFSALSASAKVELKSLNNYGNRTTVVFTISEDEKDSTNGINVDNIVLECNGKAYTAKKINAKFGTTTTVTVKFKKLKNFSHSRLTFTLNGEERCIVIHK